MSKQIHKFQELNSQSEQTMMAYLKVHDDNLFHLLTNPALPTNNNSFKSMSSGCNDVWYCGRHKYSENLYPEDRGSMDLRKVGLLPQNHMASQPR
jgi:hypothetical protein